MATELVEHQRVGGYVKGRPIFIECPKDIATHILVDVEDKEGKVERRRLEVLQ